MIYEILDQNNQVINTILASLDFVTTHYPGKFRDVTQPVIDPAIEQRAVLSTLHTENTTITKNLNIQRLLKQGKIAQALKLQGE
jgi:hypothetical protein